MKPIIYGIIVVLMIVGGYFYFNSNPYAINEKEKEVLNYLISEKGYQTEEIQYIKGGYDWMKISSYYVTVVFKDEPNGEYIFMDDRLAGQFYLSGYSGVVEKHLKRLQLP